MATTIFSYGKGKMQICEGLTAVAQCGAPGLCGFGFAVCKPSEFIANGGLTEMPVMTPQTTWAWLAGCIGTSPTDQSGPKEGVCSACKSVSYPQAPFAYDCANNAPVSISSNWPMGLTVIGSKWQVSSTGPCGYWYGETVSSKTRGAVCCQIANP